MSLGGIGFMKLSIVGILFSVTSFRWCLFSSGPFLVGLFVGISFSVTSLRWDVFQQLASFRFLGEGSGSAPFIKSCRYRFLRDVLCFLRPPWAAGGCAGVACLGYLLLEKL